MNCREAQSQIFAARDGAPDENPRAALEGHVAHCAACRQVRDNLTAALGAWRSDSARAIVPDAEREWHAVRRRIRGGAEAGSVPARARRNIFTWLPLTLGAAVAAAITVMVVVQPSTESNAGFGSKVAARADYVEAPGNDASTAVFVDDKSGWVIVLASDNVPKHG